MPRKKRSLYDCLEARVRYERIRCAKGHSLNRLVPDGTIAVTKLERGEPLEIKTCQGCPDFNPHDGAVLKEDRGWYTQLIMTDQYLAKRG